MWRTRFFRRLVDGRDSLAGYSASLLGLKIFYDWFRVNTSATVSMSVRGNIGDPRAFDLWVQRRHRVPVGGSTEGSLVLVAMQKRWYVSMGEGSTVNDMFFCCGDVVVSPVSGAAP